MKISVVVHPNSKQPRIAPDSSGVLHIYVSAPAREGLANEAVAGSLAKYFKMAKSKIVLKRGGKSKRKIFEIDE